MPVWISAYVAAAVVMLALDGVWLGTMATQLYRPALGDLLKDSFSPAPAIAFYVVYVLGIVVLAIAPALQTSRWIAAAQSAAWRGALLGFVAYATYDLTNLATLRAWSLRVTLADLCWGTVLTAMASAAGAAVATWVSQRP